MRYKSEKDYLDKIQKFLEIKGFIVWREVIPDECFNWDKPYRVDLIFYREDLGYFGVEGKNCNTFRQGGKIAGALEQVKKYRKLHYFKGLEIKQWAISFPHEDFNDGLKEAAEFVKNFLNYYDVDLLEFEENKHYSKRILISKCTPNRTIYIVPDEVYGSKIKTKNKLEKWF